MIKSFALVGLAALTYLMAGRAGAASECIDISSREALSFTGTLRHRIFAGPPNYTDVRKGDTPEPAYILELTGPECADGDDMLGDAATFDRIHLVPSERDAPDLRQLVGKRVIVRGRDAYGGHTGHHRAPVVMSIVSIASDSDPTVAYGTAMTTVQAFYLALAAGDGGEAARNVVPEKRMKGPLSSPELARFYGTLTEPLKLLDVTSIGGGRFQVEYSYVAPVRRRCNGVAIVETRRVRDANLISAIRALRGC